MNKPIAFTNLPIIAWLVLAFVAGLLWLPVFMACFFIPVAGLLVGFFSLFLPLLILIFSARAMNARRDLSGVPTMNATSAILIGEIGLFIGGVITFNLILKATGVGIH